MLYDRRLSVYHWKWIEVTFLFPFLPSSSSWDLITTPPHEPDYRSMMKHTSSWCQTPPSVTVRVKPNSARSLQIRRGLRMKRANGQDAQGPPQKSQSSRRRGEMLYAKMSLPPTIVIQRQEMASYFRLFGEWIVASEWWKLVLIM